MKRVATASVAIAAAIDLCPAHARTPAGGPEPECRVPVARGATRDGFRTAGWSIVVPWLCAWLAAIAGSAAAGAKPDWLVDPTPFKATVAQDPATGHVTLDNGLVRRVIRTRHGCATIAYDSLMDSRSLLRSVRPEARVTLEGKEYPVGGLDGQPVHNYLDPRWLPAMKPLGGAFEFEGVEFGESRERFPWKKRPEWMPQDRPWPPPGKAVTLRFRPPAAFAGKVGVDVHYELYDGLPAMSKWIVVRNETSAPVRLNALVSEILAIVDRDTTPDAATQRDTALLYVGADYNFYYPCQNNAVGEDTVHYKNDPLYATQINYFHQSKCLIECHTPYGPDQVLPPGGVFESFRVYEMPFDSSDRERRGLFVRRLNRALNPWVTENPILMHVRSADPAAVRLAIDQCAEVGFELVILTFGSGFDFESRDPAYQQQIKELADYGRARGVALGGYSLLASRGAADPADNTQGAPTMFSVMPCLGTKWGTEYLAQLRRFIASAGLGALEHDGSYTGDRCAATNHPGHRGLDDSQWVMWKAITDFYKWCRGQGVYLNVPADYLSYSGVTKVPMGYRETNWSLPREYQEIIERQNIFDGTWDKTPSMGWMFVPLTQYHGGGAAATVEPLKEHLPHYGQRLANLFGAGVQACYRGPRLFDSDETKAVVKKWVDFYRKHRAILDSDILHLRRADGQDIDYILHVNPALTEKGLLMVYNPLDTPVERTIIVPLYYTGLTDKAKIRQEEGASKTYRLDREFNVRLPVALPARGSTWLVIE